MLTSISTRSSVGFTSAKFSVAFSRVSAVNKSAQGYLLHDTSIIDLNIYSNYSNDYTFEWLK